MTFDRMLDDNTDVAATASAALVFAKAVLDDPGSAADTRRDAEFLIELGIDELTHRLAGVDEPVNPSSESAGETHLDSLAASPVQTFTASKPKPRLVATGQPVPPNPGDVATQKPTLRVPPRHLRGVVRSGRIYASRIAARYLNRPWELVPTVAGTLTLLSFVFWLAVSPDLSRDAKLLTLTPFLFCAPFFLLAWLCTIFYYEERKVDRKSRLTEIAGLEVLCAVPFDRDLLGGVLIDFSSDSSPAAQAYATLCRSVIRRNREGDFRRIAVTSASPGEGKTTTAMNLAAALAQTGVRVVLVDADLGRTTGLFPVAGLTNYLAGEKTLDKLLRLSEVDGVQILTSGDLAVPDLEGLLQSKRAIAGIEYLSTLFDYVIIDSASLESGPAASIISSWVDGLVLVVRTKWRQRTRTALEIARLDTAARAKIVGAVMTGVHGDERGIGNEKSSHQDVLSALASV